jgi:acyl-CoA reductase-like NAD-dependent aldehyde dehydrogenase
MGIFGNSGQVCAAGSRLFLHEAIFDRFLDGLVAFTQKLRVGPGHEEGVALGPLISAPQRDKVMAYIEAGRREGATLLTGGDAPSGKGYSSTPPSLSIPTRHEHRARGNFRPGALGDEIL